MDPDRPGMTVQELQARFGAIVAMAEEHGYKSLALFINDDFFKGEYGICQHSTLNPDQLRMVVNHLIRWGRLDED